MVRQITALLDIARFTEDDDAELVAAAFACPVCLRVDADVAVDRAIGDASAACSCRRCATEWEVGLDPAQVLRLALYPPPRQHSRWILRLRFRRTSS